MERFKVAIFDVDGTLLDTTEGVVAAVRHTIQKNGLQQLTEEELRSFIGPPVQESFRNFYGMEPEQIQKLADDFRDFYKQPENLYLARPYDGIYEVMEKLMEKKFELLLLHIKDRIMQKRL